MYQYAASLNTAVAKNAKTVKYTDCEREMDIDVCYRVKGKVSLKGVIVFGCACVDAEELDSLPDGYPIILMATSADNYRGVTFAEGDVWTANRLGSPLSSKAKIAELGFDTQFRAGPTNAGACVREYELRHAGFGTAGMVESGDGYDITSIAGTVIGSALAPYCSADQNTCPRCVDNGECKVAIAFEPCTVDDCAPYDGENTETGVAFGSFTVKYNKTLASAIKNIDSEDIQETIDALVPKVFGKNAVTPSYANYNDYFNVIDALSQASYDAAVTFTDRLSSTTMTLTYDGTHYWSCSGGSSSGYRLAKYTAAGAWVQSFQPNVDWRSVYSQNGNGTPVYGRGFSSSQILIMNGDGTFANHITLVGGSLNSQSSVVLDDTGDELIAFNAGTVTRWNAATGALIGTVTLDGFGTLNGENDYPQNRGIIKRAGFYLTYAGPCVLTAWDADGNRVSSTTLTGAGTSFDSYFSLSYANGMVFIVDNAGGLWRGYNVGM
ncbi:MAG: hypothetical protein FJ222_08435 [Lentisphaerae bacterium]|nr:hypothetical protein [Lentisphaerota bacterium]